MGFYEEISKYYDYIFPVGNSQLAFIKASAGEPPVAVLDVACGSGGYSVELAKSGYKVTAVDIDAEMMRKTSEKALGERLDIHTARLDMKELEKALPAGYDCIFCIGNSIVHLGSFEEIAAVLKQMYNLLSDRGALILQIINYDRVFRYQVNGLPPIRNEEIGLEFIRRYEYAPDKGLIYFNTTLTVGGERYENSIGLLPVKSADMMEMLLKSGFEEIEFYGDFKFASYDDDAYMLVVRAFKKQSSGCPK